MKKEKYKCCSICETYQPRSAFPRHETQVHKLEYCQSCKEQINENVLIKNPSNFAIDIVSSAYADELILAHFITFKNGTYYAIDDIVYREKIKFVYPSLTTIGMVLAVGKYDEKRNSILYETAERLVAEGACVWENHLLRHLYAGKELAQMVLMRDEYRCHYCPEAADRMTFLTPRSQGGLLSPQNSVAVCQSCKEIYGEDLYFFQWLNVPVLQLDAKNKENAKEVYVMWDKEKQTRFWIKKAHAQELLNQQMAALIEDRTIHIEYNQKELWAYVRTRDNWTCHYCGKYGDTVDHITPRSKGGMSTPINCVCACGKCNANKSDLKQEDFISKRKST